jgi:2-oxoglutarate/2-oxoacid ferredoxin oxidoreductase subunit beta
MEVNDFIRKDRLPFIWCPGCGNGTVLKAILTAVKDLNFTNDDVVLVSGIGCSSRAPMYTIFDNIHSLHGRAIPLATAIKLVRPSKKVIVMTGDGDSLAIGGNHLIHAARRNVDLTVVIFNNSIYGMTGGQVSPLTPTDKRGTTAQFGNIENTFDTMRLLEGAGATYIARSGTYFLPQTIKYIKNGINHEGFSLIEVITQCPVYYGRLNNEKSAGSMLLWQKENLILKEKALELSKEDLIGKIIIGEYLNIERESYLQKRYKLVERVMQDENRD